ncbi:GNAT family N-acetyltransferase [Pedobacter cryoconitis]|uniref:Putative acetyltransferase n=1 Tax=Pedobacter cryoconitis TaxID=188932 RepID=A0A7X0J2U5_9SPHI|nr:GNAT family N-acetyltransferase [Pedobacter cryoconitis]MBB6500069.1 putative acetyltransferase [Pedobacter cryoconitis]
MGITIREIQPEDNAAMAVIIKTSLEEFGLNIPGTAYFDDSTNHLYESFRVAGSKYFVATEGGQILGGAGVYPSEGLPADTVELVKMYLVPEHRGKGLGKMLMQKCMALAGELGYKNIYLESMPELAAAVSAYKKLGFELLDKPVGNTGHYSCTIWMLHKIGV